MAGDMVVVDGIRYRRTDAERRGLVDVETVGGDAVEKGKPTTRGRKRANTRKREQPQAVEPVSAPASSTEE